MLDGLNMRSLMSSGLNSGESDEINPDVPGYEIVEPIGQGGMGTVYLARQVSLDRMVALKVLRMHESIPKGQRAILMNRLESEARVMAKLNHPNLVSVYDFVKLDGTVSAIIMELVTCGNVRKKYEQLQPDSVVVEDVVSIAYQVSSCLVAAHGVGVVHRDIKPENLLIGADEGVKVSDFGLALDGESARMTASGASVGTIGYSAPEQLDGVEVDERADLYSLGVVIYELLTGIKPMGDVKRLRSLREDVPLWLETLVIEALQPKPDDRIASASEFLRKLESGRESQNESSFNLSR